MNEAPFHMNNIYNKALIDTGSCVSVISDTFYLNNLKETKFQPLNGILTIKCADGNHLPYLGFIEVSITDVEGSEGSKPTLCIFLLTPDTTCNANTPVILGTNNLYELMQDC